MAETEELLREIIANQKEERRIHGIFESLNIVVAVFALMALGFSWLVIAGDLSPENKRIYISFIVVGSFVYVFLALLYFRKTSRKKA